MAWSTRELAELAGTTVKAVRHYHSIGLLDEPARASNGYKQYGVAHLVRLLRITRLKELGVPLAAMRSDAAADLPTAIRALDGELAERIARLQHIRAELAAALEHNAPLDTPAAFHAVAESLSDRDRALATVLGGVFDGAALGDLSALMAESTDADEIFDALPPDADDATIEDLAQRLAASIREQHERFPWMADPTAASARGRNAAEQTLGAVFLELYNPAQMRALARAAAMIDE
ncbi:MerR family transcriptional regulator [Tsukamurella ocularis]|uniref:MerR family transcriptional regulator n=1 Tax=Tsukamurella ocularis TaxID=1970234 RepID=UPI002167C098|nr:MerR family transcriptional regulator [Tsukamurella ocularis]MCS3781081.1 DNA-binding transcriptional MerR regulator [Tsukamurella ocularis]MCS3786905.1 DNA-binding transcriptional MerR regulator [Tsukamurella ocularis]MCS3850747.1 DNA-binding transcriptional MerR regulator [Tsukamurella ocularis]